MSRRVSRRSSSSSTTKTGPRPLRPTSSTNPPPIKPVRGQYTLLRFAWKHDLKRRTATRRALDLELPAVGVDDLLHDPEAHAEPAVVRLGDGALEAPEDPLLVGEGDADPPIRDGES